MPTIEGACTCEPDSEEEKVCLARRENGICPQLPIIEQLKRKIQWLEDSRGIDCTIKGGLI